jgi:hypothetical protein
MSPTEFTAIGGLAPEAATSHVSYVNSGTCLPAKEDE